MSDKKNHSCSFCQKSEESVKKLIAGPDNLFICDECVDLCKDILDDDIISNNDDIDLSNIPKPMDIYEHLNKHIIGQDKSKRTLSTAIYNHYKRHYSKDKTDTIIEKSNILMIGSTGSGKTLFAKIISKLLNVPFAMADATTLTEAGYVGDDVEHIIHKLYVNANHDLEKVSRGIVYIDEIDKISKKSENMSTTNDVGGEGVQQGLLKLIEGTVVSFPPNGGRKNPQQELLSVDTSDILFICGGAFVGLESIIEKRIGGSGGMGFNSEIKDINEDQVAKNSDLFQQVQEEDLTKFGIIPELKGRLPVVTSLESLTRDMLISILTEPENSLVSQYKSLIGIDSMELIFEPESFIAIADRAIKNKTGARGLRSIMEKSLEPIMFEAPSRSENGYNKVTITKEYIETLDISKIIYSKQKKIIVKKEAKEAKLA
jgi:ATP-dependent Clp protease ATP-binding subunit ClpX